MSGNFIDSLSELFQFLKIYFGFRLWLDFVDLPSVIINDSYLC